MSFTERAWEAIEKRKIDHYELMLRVASSIPDYPACFCFRFQGIQFMARTSRGCDYYCCAMIDLA